MSISANCSAGFMARSFWGTRLQTLRIESENPTANSDESSQNSTHVTLEKETKNWISNCETNRINERILTFPHNSASCRNKWTANCLDQEPPSCWLLVGPWPSPLCRYLSWNRNSQLNLFFLSFPPHFSASASYKSGNGNRLAGGAFGSLLAFLLSNGSFLGFFFLGFSPPSPGSPSSSSSTTGSWISGSLRRP